MFSAPTAVNLELTEICNIACRHCYNFWRKDGMSSISLYEEKMDRLVEKFREAGIFHVILTGGEPFAKFDVLEHAVGALLRNNISVSCNSNLMLTTEDRIKRLAAAGLDHILTSLPSGDPATCDHIMNQVGAFEKVVKGIKETINGGIRVSANMVLMRNNLGQVYQTAELLSQLGAQKLFFTRSVPPVYQSEPDADLDVGPEEMKDALDAALQAKADFGIQVGSLVSYPLCFLGDLEKYADFVGRGCPSQSGHRMSINATGDIHACVHEDEDYGNVFESPLVEIYQTRMRKWHDQSFYYEGCRSCEYMEVCESGCSMMALGHYGSHKEKDPLFVGPQGITGHFKVANNAEIYNAMDSGMAFSVPKRLRFRKENGFYLLSIRWANVITIPTAIAELLISHQHSGEAFTLEDMGEKYRDFLAGLFFKDAVEFCNEGEAIQVKRESPTGLSVNLENLPGVSFSI
ncbi:MAG: radical SAM protein [Candidatus Latescibacteria bacterium]|nr:radical SAM protein [Candidatus Latescibacterota bacterium]